MLFTTLLFTALTSVSAASVNTMRLANRQTGPVVIPQSDPNFAIVKDLTQDINVKERQQYAVPHPAGAPCSLIASFEAGFQGIEQSGETLIDVYAIDGPAPGALVGSFRIDPVNGQKTTINSFACRDVLTFDFEISSDERPGDVAFTADVHNGIFLQVGY